MQFSRVHVIALPTGGDPCARMFGGSASARVSDDDADQAPSDERPFFVSCGLLADLLCCLPASDRWNRGFDLGSFQKHHTFCQRIPKPLAQLRSPSASRVVLVGGGRFNSWCFKIVHSVKENSLCLFVDVLAVCVCCQFVSNWFSRRTSFATLSPREISGRKTSVV